MAEKEGNVKVRLRTDSAVNWLNVNPVLLKGEIGVEEDTGRIKIGNGKSSWAVLPYFFAGMSKQEILDAFFPINTVRITVGDINPADTLGGVWQKAVGTQRTEFTYWVRME